MVILLGATMRSGQQIQVDCLQMRSSSLYCILGEYWIGYSHDAIKSTDEAGEKDCTWPSS